MFSDQTVSVENLENPFDMLPIYKALKRFLSQLAAGLCGYKLVCLVFSADFFFNTMWEIRIKIVKQLQLKKQKVLRSCQDDPLPAYHTLGKIGLG